MRRVKRDYCGLGKHPKWKAWVAKYDMTDVNHWPHIGNFCIYCNVPVSDTVANNAPEPAPEHSEAWVAKLIAYKTRHWHSRDNPNSLL